MIKLLNYILAADSGLVAALTVVGVIIIVAIVTLFIIAKMRSSKKEEEKPEKKPQPVKEAPVKLTEEEKQAIKVEKAKVREENEKHEANRRIKALSELAIEKRNEYFVNEDPNGIEAVGIIFNKKSKVYMFGPKGYKLNVGDVVIVKDFSGVERQVPVVVPNRMVNEADLVQPFKEIEAVVYQTEAKVEYTPVEEPKPVEEEPVVEEVVEEKAPTFVITFDNQGHGEVLDACEGMEAIPDELPLLHEEGFEFKGWALEPNAEELVELGMKLEGDVTLYALWEEVKMPEAVVEPEPQPVVEEVVEEKAPTFVITFDNQGHGEVLDAYEGIEAIPNELPLLHEEGFEFKGWALEPNAEELVELGMKLEGDVTLYALWEEVKMPEAVVEPQPVAEDAEEDEEDEKEEAESDTQVVYNEVTHTYTVIRKKRAYEGRICVASKENKGFYNEVKNRLLSYGLVSRISKTGEKFRVKRNQLAQIKFTAKQMVLYLALEPNQFENTKYKGKDVSAKKAYASTPFQYKTKSERKTQWMLELIDLLAKKHNLQKIEDYKDVDFAKDYPFLDEQGLIDKGYLTITEKTVSEVSQVEADTEEDSE